MRVKKNLLSALYKLKFVSLEESGIDSAGEMTVNVGRAVQNISHGKNTKFTVLRRNKRLFVAVFHWDMVIR